MAKRSDFTQKLLDDLRLRKEKLGYAQSSKQPVVKPDKKAHRNSQRSSPGLGEATANNLTSKKMQDTMEVTKVWLGTRHHKTPAREGAIVPFSRARAEHTTDVSMALALALNSNGKLQNIELFTNSIVGNKLIQHRGSINLREMSRRQVTNGMRSTNDQFPFLSNLQLGEISKSIQNLQKTLTACSNGFSISRDSIDIGRELLRGAMDLEESLRMLVTLQESSDYMVGSQGKPVKLLKGKEDAESSSHEKAQKEKSRPRLSFDGTSRHSLELATEENNSKILQPGRAKNLKSNSYRSSSNVSTEFISHKRSLSCGPGSKPDAQFSSIKSKSSQNHEERSFSDRYNHSSSENIRKLNPKVSLVSEKVRIPNVVAKLMGLEELPVHKAEVKNIGVQRVSNPKKVGEGSLTLTLDADTGKKETHTMMNSRNYFCEIDSPKKSLYGSSAKNKPTAIPEAVSSKKKANAKNLHSMKSTSMTATPKTQFKVRKPNGMAKLDDTKEATKADECVEALGKGQGNKEQDLKGNIKQIARDAERSTMSYSSRSHDEAISKQELAQQKKNLILPSDLPHAAKDNVSTQRPEIYMSKSLIAVHRSGEETEPNSNKKPESKLAEKSDLKLKEKVKSTKGIKTENAPSSGSTSVANKKNSNKRTTAELVHEYPKKNNNHKGGVTRKKSSAYHELDRETANESSERSRTLKLEAISDIGKSTPSLQLAVITKQVCNPCTPKADREQVTQVKANDITMEEDPIRNEALHVKGQCLKQQPSILQELERRWKEKTGRAEEATVTICSMNSEQNLDQKTLPANLPCPPPADDCKQVMDHIAAEDAPNKLMDNKEYAVQQSPAISHEKDPGLQLFKSKKNGSEDSTNKREVQAIEGQEPLLTKNEVILQHILLNSQPFLSTAQALFNLEIPVSLLQASEQECDENVKLLSDCGYEIMRRKGKREEVISNFEATFVQLKPRGLDALIRELSGDLESLKFHSENGLDEHDAAAECLHKLLERDIKNRHPDINCMWDFGWSSIAFADVEKSEIIRDVEKDVLDGLISEITRDLCHV